MPHFPTLKDFLKSKHPGVEPERIVERTQGCWNCVHFSTEKAQKLWWDKARQDYLTRATVIAVDSPLGERHPHVMNIRKMVPLIDEAVTTGNWGCCSVGKQPDGSPVADFVASTYLCDVWTGAPGASVARAGQKADKLPEEVMERAFEPKPE